MQKKTIEKRKDRKELVKKGVGKKESKEGKNSIRTMKKEVIRIKEGGKEEKVRIKKERKERITLKEIRLT